MTVFAALGVAFSFVLFFALNPAQASAFWPFSSKVDAAGNSSPIVHDPSLDLLEAATNPDPNPVKGGSPLALADGDALIASAGPSGTPSADTSSQAGQISLYTVRQGDTLGEIATMFGVSVNTIVWANNLGSAKAVHAGQTLVILPVSGVEHKVIKGDTLASIAKKYGADADEVADFNGLAYGSALAVGDTLIIPGGEVKAVVPTKSSGTTRAPANPYRGGSGAEMDGYYTNPVPSAILTQGIHGYNGIDLGAAKGTPILAAASGAVIVARNNGAWNGGYGNYVVIAHGNGTQTLYAHMVNTIVSPGQSVAAGQVIGYVGRTGEATGYHLHFEVRGAKNPFAACRVGSRCSPQ